MQRMPLKNRPRSSRMVWAKRLIRLYPVSWRERYSDEMLAILEEHPPTLWALGDLFFNLCDAHLHIEIVPVRIPIASKQLYTGVTTIFCSCLLFYMLTAGTLFDYTINNFFSTGNTSVFSDLIGELETPYLFITLLLLLILGGLPLFASTCWQAIRTKRIQILFLYLIGIFSLFIASRAGNAVDIIADPLYNFIYRFFGGEAYSFSSWQWLTLLMAFSRFSPGYDLFVCTGICALWLALQQSVPTTHLTKFTLIPAILIPPVMFAYLFGPLSSLIASPLIRTVLIERRHATLFTYIRLDIIFLLMPMLIALYGLFRMYQVRQTLILKTE